MSKKIRYIDVKFNEISMSYFFLIAPAIILKSEITINQLCFDLFTETYSLFADFIKCIRCGVLGMIRFSHKIIMWLFFMFMVRCIVNQCQ